MTIDRRTVEEGRAQFALQKVERHRTSKEYKAYVKRLPMLIRNNGLAAAAAFYKGKGEEQQAVIHDVEAWLQEQGYPVGGNSGLDGYAVSRDSEEYRALTVEVLAFLGWLKRFADARIEGEVDN